MARNHAQRFDAAVLSVHSQVEISLVLTEGVLSPLTAVATGEKVPRPGA